MTGQLERKFGCLFEDYGMIILLVIGALILCGDDLLENLFCDDMTIIWIVLIVLLFMNFDNDCCC